MYIGYMAPTRQEMVCTAQARKSLPIPAERPHPHENSGLEAACDSLVVCACDKNCYNGQDANEKYWANGSGTPAFSRRWRFLCMAVAHSGWAFYRRKFFQ